MTTNVQRCTDINAIPAIPTIRRPRRAPGRKAQTAADVQAEIAAVEWMMGTATVTEIARRVGRKNPAALARFLVRARRWDLAIEIMPIPLEPRHARENDIRLEDARRRAAVAYAEPIAWALAWVAASELPLAVAA